MLTYFLPPFHFFFFFKTRFWEFNHPCRLVNGLFRFFLSSLFCVCEWGCGRAAASLHPFSPHGGRVVLTKTICNGRSRQRARHSHQTFPQKHFNIATLPRARGSEERLRGESQRAAGKVSWSRFGGTLLAPSSICWLAEGGAGGGGKCCGAEGLREAAGGAAMYGSHRLLKAALSW